MFKGKVVYVQNINGQEKKIEREFDNPQEYNNFVSSHPELAGFSQNGSAFSGFNSLFDFNSYLNNFFDSKFTLGGPNKETQTETKDNSRLLVEGVDVNTYEKELQKIEEEKEHDKAKQNALEKTLEKLKSFLEKFTKEKREDLIEKIKKDIQKVEKELKSFVSK